MRILLVLFLIVLAAPAIAQQAVPTATAPNADQDRLDALFSELKREHNEKAAQRIAGRIWAQWRDSGSATADLLMQRANTAIGAKKYNVALDLLDQVVVLFPGYVEGWNRRATLHYMMDDYAKSMSDISRALDLEPRHFGAISGMAGIFKETGRKERALEAYRRVLAIYPMMRSAQNEVTRLSDELAGEGI